jgi:tetratricopeptide (TPR) repeat protein
MQMGDLDVALEWMKKAVALSPTYAYNPMGVAAIYSEFGDFEQTETWISKALALQPDLGHAHCIMIDAALEEGRMDLAREHARLLEEIGPEDPSALVWAAVPDIYSGDFEAATEKLERAVSMFREHSSEPIPGFPATVLAYVYLKTEHSEEAEELLKEAEERERLNFERGVEVWGVAYNMATTRSMQGNKDEALEWLDKAVDMGWRNYKEAVRNPLLESLHGDERFNDVISRARALVDEMRQRVEG